MLPAEDTPGRVKLTLELPLAYRSNAFERGADSRHVTSHPWGSEQALSEYFQKGFPVCAWGFSSNELRDGHKG